MIIKLKIKSKKNHIAVWIQRNNDIETDIQQLFQFFENKMKVSKVRRILPYYKVTTENHAIIWSFYTALQDIIPEIYLTNEDSVEFEEIMKS